MIKKRLEKEEVGAWRSGGEGICVWKVHSYVCILLGKKEYTL